MARKTLAEQAADIETTARELTGITEVTVGASCGTIGCKRDATHNLTYSFPESRDQVERDSVCEPCGAGYVRRPTLRASLTVVASAS